jgi:hypothetical protein
MSGISEHQPRWPPQEDFFFISSPLFLICIIGQNATFLQFKLNIYL